MPLRKDRGRDPTVTRLKQAYGEVIVPISTDYRIHEHQHVDLKEMPFSRPDASTHDMPPTPETHLRPGWPCPT